MNNLVFKSVVSKKLKEKEILNICKLKNTHWKYSLKSQLKWFKENVKKDDLHNLVYLKNKLIGYNLLRKRTFILKIKKNYLYFDTLIVSKKYRNKKIGIKLNIFIIEIIKKSKLHSMLICKKKSSNFYKKFNWKIIIKKNFKIIDHVYPTSYMGMSFNQNKILSKNKIEYFVYN